MKRKILLDALAAVRPGLDTKEIVAQTTSFAFLDGRIVSYNDSLSISYPIKELKGITGAVQAEEFYAFLLKNDVEDIEVKVTDTEIEIISDKAKAGFTFQSEVTLPLEEVEIKHKWKPLPEGFVPALKMAIISCARDLAEESLTAVHVQAKGIIESCDTYRLTQYQIGKIPMEEDFILIDLPQVKELINYPITEICSLKENGWAHFKTETGAIISCRLKAGKWKSPKEVQRFKDAIKESVKLTFPKSLIEVLERASIFAKQAHWVESSVDITMEDRTLTINSKNIIGWIQEWVRVNYKGKKFSFSINPIFLSEILKMTREGQISPIAISFEGENWLHIVRFPDDEKGK